MLCFCLISFPRSCWRRHSSLPVARSRQSRSNSCPPGPLTPPGAGRFFLPGGNGSATATGAATTSSEGELRKIRSPQIVGEEPLHAGVAIFHLMFCVGLHVSGRFFAVVVVPSPLGPRQPGQLAAAAVRVAVARPAKISARPTALRERRLFKCEAEGAKFMGRGIAKRFTTPNFEEQRRRRVESTSAMQSISARVTEIFPSREPPKVRCG